MKNFKYKYNKDIFFREDDLSYYLLGAFMTDGCIAKNGISSWKSIFSTKDEDWIINIRDLVCPELKIQQGNQVKVIELTNKEIGEWFISKGCVPRKSAILKFPNVPKNYIPDFLRGVFDGDGTVSLYETKGGYAVRSAFITISEDFAKAIHEVLLNLNIKNALNIVYKKPCKIGNRIVIANYPQYKINLGPKSTCNLLKLMYYPNHKISMPRKCNLAFDILDLNEYVYFK